MSFFLGQPARNLLDAPLVLPNGVEKLGRALWLYVRLLTLTNSRGLIIRKRDLLAVDLQASEEQIDTWLARLVEAELIEIESPAPYLVIKLGLWSDGDGLKKDDMPPGGASSLEEAASGYSHSKLSNTHQESYSYSQQEIPSAGDDMEALLAEVLGTLGESDPTSFRPVLARYSPDVIRQALQRVKTAGQIRKSKTALFRYLLGKLSEHSHAPT